MQDFEEKSDFLAQNDPIKVKILQFLAAKRLKVQTFASIIDMSASNFSGKMLLNKLGSDAIIKILAQFPELSAEWLMRGVGPMLLTDGTAVATDHSIAVHTNEGSITQTNQLPFSPSEQIKQPVPGSVPDCEHCSKLTIAQMKVEHLKTLVEAKDETIQVLKDCINRD